MKRGILFLSMLMMASLMGAMESNEKTTNGAEFYPDLSSYSVDFMERGIHFYVFLDGTFDFTSSQTAEVDYLYKSGRRGTHTAPRGIRIERDFNGRIFRVGNVFINYTYHNKVKRIGTVFIKYSHRQMKRIGNLQIVYNRYGVNFIGSVKGRPHYYNPYVSYQWTDYNSFYFGDIWEYGYYDPFFYGHRFNSDFERFDEDDNFYYYKNKRADNSKGKVIKRKKASKSKKNEIRKKVNTSKRKLAQSNF